MSSINLVESFSEFDKVGALARMVWQTGKSESVLILCSLESNGQTIIIKPKNTSDDAFSDWSNP
jgi:hypothetical protein